MDNPFDTRPPYGMEFLQGNLSAPVLVFASESEVDEARPNIRGFICVSPLSGYTFLQTDWSGYVVGRHAIAVGSQAFIDRAANILEWICRPLHVTTGDVAKAAPPDPYRVRFKRLTAAEPGFPFTEIDRVAGMDIGERKTLYADLRNLRKGKSGIDIDVKGFEKAVEAAVKAREKTSQPPRPDVPGLAEGFCTRARCGRPSRVMRRRFARRSGRFGLKATAMAFRGRLPFSSPINGGATRKSLSQSPRRRPTWARRFTRSSMLA
jgi:hypothetical protein